MTKQSVINRYGGIKYAKIPIQKESFTTRDVMNFTNKASRSMNEVEGSEVNNEIKEW
ncbi:MAG TPA: hypothetical protein GX703_03165 [Erysipelothrix sp.]|jgi:hypothetical protein|nr:hypothetical protein [Erysipelothrix sp.]